MMLFPRWRSFTRRSKVIICVALIVAISLVVTGLRARRLLLQAHQIAIQSAQFPRDYWVGSGPDLTYLAMGDSTAAGWGAGAGSSTYPYQIASALAARHRRVRVVNVAVGGATLAEVRGEQSAALQRVRPDLVTLSVGANDATRGTSPIEFRREMRLLMADLEASSAQTVLVANVPDMFLAPALPYPLALITAKRARALNTELAGLPKSSKLRAVDLFGAGKLDYGRDAGLYAADLFHPSGRGYALWAQLFVQQLEPNAMVAAPATQRR